MPRRPTASLRERKQQRTRRALIDTAMRLFVERGFENVTVSEIAEAAEVGRTTFFRYFDDKQEILFAQEDQLFDVLADALDQAAEPRAPIGDSVGNALVVLREGLHALAEAIAEDAETLPIRERLIQENASLRARNLVKQNRYVNLSIDRLTRHGADPQAATLAAGIATVCFTTAYAAAAHDLSQMPAQIDAMLRRLTEIDLNDLGLSGAGTSEGRGSHGATGPRC